jgi:polyisoprenoid-binding protein YceI
MHLPSIKRTLKLAVGLALISGPVFADAPGFALVPEQSSLKFIAIQNGAPVEGKFKNFTTDIHFDHEKPEASSIKVEVDTGSAVVANEDVEKNVKLPEWLSVDAFPKAVFVCSKLTRMPESENYYADGTLTLRGKTVPVVLNFQLDHFDGQKAIATGYITVRRNDFGVGQGQWAKDDVIKNEVRVEFRIVAQKK